MKKSGYNQARMKQRALTAIMVGAGGRGTRAYAPYATHHADELKFVGVAEPDTRRRERFVRQHPAAGKCAVSSWEEILDKPKTADLAFVCTQDRMHFEPAKAAISRAAICSSKSRSLRTPGNVSSCGRPPKDGG